MISTQPVQGNGLDPFTSRVSDECSNLMSYPCLSFCPSFFLHFHCTMNPTVCQASIRFFNLVLSGSGKNRTCVLRFQWQVASLPSGSIYRKASRMGLYSPKLNLCWCRLLPYRDAHAFRNRLSTSILAQSVPYNLLSCTDLLKVGRAGTSVVACCAVAQRGRLLMPDCWLPLGTPFRVQIAPKCKLVVASNVAV